MWWFSIQLMARWVFHFKNISLIQKMCYVFKQINRSVYLLLEERINTLQVFLNKCKSLNLVLLLSCIKSALLHKSVFALWPQVWTWEVVSRGRPSFLCVKKKFPLFAGENCNVLRRSLGITTGVLAFQEKQAWHLLLC